MPMGCSRLWPTPWRAIARKKTGALNHALGFHIHPRKREWRMFSPKDRGRERGSAFIRLDQRLATLQNWPVATVRPAPFTRPSSSCLGDPRSCLCPRRFLDTSPGPYSRAWRLEALSGSSLLALDLSQRALVLLTVAADFDAGSPQSPTPKGLSPPPG